MHVAMPPGQQSGADLFVVGAAKSGTTALYHYFRHHPSVFVPTTVKETNFMAFEGGFPKPKGPGDARALSRSITRWADYLRLYGGRTQETVAADVSPAYLYYPQAPRKIAERAPHAKIVIILRNPVECVHSMYAMMRRERREPCRSLLKAFAKSEQRLANGWEWAWDYKNCYRFSAQVKRYLDLFPSSQLFIRRYEDLQNHPQEYYDDLIRFVGIGPIDLERANRRVNTAPRRIDMLQKKRAGRIIYRAGSLAGGLLPQAISGSIHRRLQTPAFTLAQDDRKKLADYFRADVLKLQQLLNWDLGEWVAA